MALLLAAAGACSREAQTPAPVAAPQAEARAELAPEPPAPPEPVAAAEAEGSPREILYHDGRLSVTLVEAERRGVLQEIGGLADVEFVFVGESEAVLLTERFRELPLDAGLRQLLEGAGSVFIYSRVDPEKIERVIVAPEGTFAEAPPAPAQPEAAQGFNRHLAAALEDLGVEIADRPAREGPPPRLPGELQEQLDQAMGELFRQRLNEALTGRPDTAPEDLPDQ